MNGLPRAARASKLRRRRCARVLCAGVGLTGAAAVVLAGPLAAPVAADGGVREEVVVDAAASDGSSTVGRLQAGTRYDLVVRGSYVTSTGTEADAECSVSSLGVWTRERRDTPSFDLLVDGVDIMWASTGVGVFGCDPEHEYRYALTASVTGPLTLRVDGGSDQMSFRGTLLVEITGAAFADDEAPSPMEPPPAALPAAPPSVDEPEHTPPPATTTTLPPDEDEASPSRAPVPPSTTPAPSAAGPAPTPAPAPAPARVPATIPAAPTRVATREELASLFLDEAGSAVVQEDPVEVELVIRPRHGDRARLDGPVLAALVVAAAVMGATSIGRPAARVAIGRVAGRRRRRSWRPARHRDVSLTTSTSLPSALEQSFFTAQRDV